MTTLAHDFRTSWNRGKHETKEELITLYAAIDGKIIEGSLEDKEPHVVIRFPDGSQIIVRGSMQYRISITK